MKFLIQVVKEASVDIDNETVGRIGRGFLIFVGVCDKDTEETADMMVKKAVNLRIFEDENGKTNLSIDDIQGSMLVISQFTLYADCRKGNRPSFIKAGNPDHAEKLYEYVLSSLKNTYGIDVKCGRFGADMQVSLINDGPFTVMLDSDELSGK
ncbi:MAG: D-tyrosyl-tRNA(Tyr) deacylase [Lachnospiraceae bacterium]|nr:D-tyrosyl-tRNA(Tyr) deacylase [Lachnospiraceae bacterium]